MSESQKRQNETETEKDNTKTTNADSVSTEGGQEKPRKRSLISRFLKGTVRVASISSGFDVIKKDSNKIRVRHPQVWRDLFSAEGARRLKRSLFTEKTKHITSFPKAAAFSALISAALLAVVITLISSNPFPSSMSNTNKAGLAFVFVLLVVCSVIYTAIATIQIGRHCKRRTRSQVK